MHINYVLFVKILTTVTGFLLALATLGNTTHTRSFLFLVPNCPK